MRWLLEQLVVFLQARVPLIIYRNSSKEIHWVEMPYRSYRRHHTNTSPSYEHHLGGNVGMAHDGNRCHGRSAIESWVPAEVISLIKLTICSFFANNAAPILCTGASPHRCKNSMKSSSLQQTRWASVPRSRNHLFPPKSQRILSTLRHAKTPNRLSQSYSKLNGGQMRIEAIIRW
jgi:hypothetical protein